MMKKKSGGKAKGAKARSSTSVQAVARLLKVPAQRLYRAIGSGNLVKGKDGSIDPEEARRVLAEQEIRGKGGSVRAELSGIKAEAMEFNVRLQRARAIAAERENLVAAGKLVPFEEYNKFLIERELQLKDLFLAMGGELCHRCEGKPAREIRTLMDERVAEILNQFVTMEELADATRGKGARKSG